jgi:hypothetical protein
MILGKLQKFKRSSGRYFVSVRPPVNCTELIEQPLPVISSGPEHPLQFDISGARTIFVTLAILIGLFACMASAAPKTATKAAKNVTPDANQGSTRDVDQPVELGNVTWRRDFEKAVAESRKTGKPMMVLFDEVPGCGGCKTYGKVLLTQPVLVEAAETLFVPVFIRNNNRDKNSADRSLLKRFKERAWNYPVVRFMNADGKDITPASRTWSLRRGARAELLTNMSKALAASDRPTPKYFELFVAQYSARKTATIQFAMGCFWSGEAKLGALPGVVSTRVGYHKLAPSAREIVEVVYDTQRTDFETIVRAAKEQKCARWIILPEDDPNFKAAKTIFGEKGLKLSSEPCTFKDNDYNYQFSIYRQPGYFFNAITPLQATRMHGDKANRASYLSPRQQIVRERIEALFKGLDQDARKALFERMKKDLNPSQYRNLYKTTLNDYQKKLLAYLEKLEAKQR